MKVHGFHRTVPGPRFGVLRQMFGEPYREFWQALDPIAERTQTPGQPAPGSLVAMAEQGGLPEAAGVAGARALVKPALDAHAAPAASAKAAGSVAGHAVDPATADLLTQRIASHDRTAWMLRAMRTEEAPTA